MVPTAGDYVITTFFKPPLLRGGPSSCRRSRPDIVAAKPTRGDHLLVYSGGSDELTDALRDCGCPHACTACATARGRHEAMA